MPEITCCFAGHRPQSPPWGYATDDPRCHSLKRRLRMQIEHLIKERGAKHFISGMALGVDIWAAEIVLCLQKKYPITLECVLPWAGQSGRWDEEHKAQYWEIIKKADIANMLQARYTPDCYQKRNHYMIDESNVVIAVWSDMECGTTNIIEYAHRRGREVVFVKL